MEKRGKVTYCGLVACRRQSVAVVAVARYNAFRKFSRGKYALPSSLQPLVPVNKHSEDDGQLRRAPPIATYPR